MHIVTHKYNTMERSMKSQWCLKSMSIFNRKRSRTQEFFSIFSLALKWTFKFHIHVMVWMCEQMLKLSVIVEYLKLTLQIYMSIYCCMRLTTTMNTLTRTSIVFFTRFYIIFYSTNKNHVQNCTIFFTPTISKHQVKGFSPLTAMLY